MTDVNKAGLEAAAIAIAECKAVGRTTLQDHAYAATTAYLEATKGGEDCGCGAWGPCDCGTAPQATDDDLVDWMWCYENPRDAANLIEQLKVEKNEAIDERDAYRTETRENIYRAKAAEQRAVVAIGIDDDLAERICE